MEYTSWSGSNQGRESGIIRTRDPKATVNQAYHIDVDVFNDEILKYSPEELDNEFNDYKVKANVTTGVTYNDDNGNNTDWNSDTTQQTVMPLGRGQLNLHEDFSDLEPSGPVDLSTVSSDIVPVSFSRNYSELTDTIHFNSAVSDAFVLPMSSVDQETIFSGMFKSENFDQIDFSQHKRNMSDAFTMRQPLFQGSHNDSFDNNMIGSNNMQDILDNHDSTIVQTPIKNVSGSSSFDRGSQHSPLYSKNGLESPMESPSITNSYGSCQPFPAVPNTITPTSSRKKNSIASPLSQRASSVSQVASPMLVDIQEKVVDLVPQTPRISKPGVNKPKHKRSTSSVSLTVTPKSLFLPNSNSQTSLKSDLSSQTSSVTKPSTPRQESSETGREEDSPKSHAKRDGRRRIGKEQIAILERNFHINPRPERDDRIKIAEETKLEQRTVQIWFQNRRAKARSMKMPPSKADLSKDASNYRAAQAAASNAIISANERPSSTSSNFDIRNSRLGNNIESRSSSLPQASPGRSNKIQTPHFNHQQQQALWHNVNLGSSSQSSGSGYHQQLPKFGYPQPQPMQGSHQPMQKIHYQNQQMQSALPSMAGSHVQHQQQHQHQQQQFTPTRMRSSYNQDSHDDNDLDASYFSESIGRPTSRSNSIASLSSVSSVIPQSPMINERVPPYVTDGRSLQSSPELMSPVAWPSSNFGSSHSTITLNSLTDWTGSHLVSDMKRRRSLYGTAVPSWPRAEHDHSTLNQTYNPQFTDVNSYNGSVAASAAAAALRSRNRSYTQPSPRSRQPSVRLQLDESNNTAQIVVLNDESERRSADGAGVTNNRDFFRQLSPGRVECAAAKTIKRRSAR